MSEQDFRVYHGWNPNQVVVRGLNQHVQITTRDGEVKEFMISDAMSLARRCANYERESTFHVRLRRLWGDNSKGNERAWIDIIGDKKDEQELLRWRERMTFPGTSDQGQTLDVHIKIHFANTQSDHFEPNAEHFYDLDHQ